MARLSLPIELHRFLRDWRTPERLCSVRLQTPSVIRTRQATHSWRSIGKAIARPSSLHHIKLDIIYCNVEFSFLESRHYFTRSYSNRALAGTPGAELTEGSSMNANRPQVQDFDQAVIWTCAHFSISFVFPPEKASAPSEPSEGQSTQDASLGSNG